jgi:hypothetical protein
MALNVFEFIYVPLAGVASKARTLRTSVPGSKRVKEY